MLGASFRRPTGLGPVCSPPPNARTPTLLLTFSLPLAAGLLVGPWAGYPWVGALLIGSLLASHALIAYPIAEKLGKLRKGKKQP